MRNDQLDAATGWLALAIVLVAMVQIVPTSNRPIQWALGLIMVYLLLTHVEQWAHIVDQLTGKVAGQPFFGRSSSGSWAPTGATRRV